MGKKSDIPGNSAPSEEEKKPAEQTTVPKPSVVRFSDGKPTVQPIDPAKERFSDGHKIVGTVDAKTAAVVQTERATVDNGGGDGGQDQYKQYSSMVHGAGESVLRPFIGADAAHGVRGFLEGIQGAITTAVTKRG